ncbi:hypothetical protein RclHR1_00410002 [Rhizophagus clarus]|uniref:Uncharacterized protein n=1 Tax=Rhizophagus clarus TaxID=94130 RepID=A0A2Z6RSG0_9GLOM|nr:hypothetical protein RclHR1_00410002 [Rhizophagus clarus]
MDIEISIPEVNQSTSNTMPITNESSEDSKFKSVLSKSQKKKQRKKEKAECEAIEAAKSSKSSLDPSAKKAKSQDKPNTRKVVENEASTVITGYQPANNSQAFVQDIIIYDIPAKCDNYTTINALSAWGKVISMTVKRQKKYKTLRVKLEILKFFKNYEKHWMAPLMGFPVRWFLASWKSTKFTRDKSHEKTKSTNASSTNDSANKRSSKKIATGANNIPLQHCRGSTFQRQYSSGTKAGQDSPKTDYDTKKAKSKSKRSSTSKKMIMAEITRINEVLESLLKRTAI